MIILIIIIVAGHIAFVQRATATHDARCFGDGFCQRGKEHGAGGRCTRRCTANPPTNFVDFRGSDSSIILSLKVGFPGP